MIGKVMTGKSFSGCVRYVVDKPEAKILEAQGVRIDSAERISRDFGMQRKMNPELTQAVGHIALSWSIRDKDKLSEAVMTQVAKAYLEKMKITDTQYLIALHQDRQHPHLHIIYNRVNNQGKTVSDRFQRQLNAKACKEITLKYGYHLAEGKGQVNRHRLTGAEQDRYQLFDAISKAVSQSTGWKGLEEKLSRQCISVQYKYKSGTTEVQGVSFGKAAKGAAGAISFKGSELDRSLSYGRISQELAHNRSALSLGQPSLAHPKSNADRNDYNYPSSNPSFSQADKTTYQEPNPGNAAYRGSGNSESAYQKTDASETAFQETKSAGLTATETAGETVTSLLSGLSFSSGDEDDEQQKKKKKKAVPLKNKYKR